MIVFKCCLLIRYFIWPHQYYLLFYVPYHFKSPLFLNTYFTLPKLKFVAEQREKKVERWELYLTISLCLYALRYFSINKVWIFVLASLWGFKVKFYGYVWVGILKDKLCSHEVLERASRERPEEELRELSPTYSLLSCEVLYSLHWRVKFDLKRKVFL